VEGTPQKKEEYNASTPHTEIRTRPAFLPLGPLAHPAKSANFLTRHDRMPHAKPDTGT